MMLSTLHHLWRHARALAVVAALFGAGSARAACTLAFTDVGVVSMERDGVAAGQTVRIDEGRIAAIGPSGQVNADGCRILVDGRGKFLAPGLIDAHVHVESLAFAAAFGVKSAPIVFADVLALYPAFGVTSVRVMSGAPDILAYRDGAKDAALPVPRLVLASPMLAGNPPILPEPATRVIETPDAARAAVQEFVKVGYDLIKIRENLRPDVFRAVVAEAKRLAIDVDGHITRSPELSVPDLITAGQRGFAHLDEIARAMDADNGWRRDEIARLLKARDGYVSTTMVVLQSAAEQIADYERLARRPEARFLHPLFTGTFWTRAQNPYLKPGVEGGFFLGLLGETKTALDFLTDRGVRILAGTDALNPMIIPGESLHEELQLMRDAGLTPYQAMRTATVNPAQVLRGLANTGALAVGRDADVLLLATNPLSDIGALRRPEGVAIGGRWFDRAALDRRLEDVAQKYRAK